MGVAHGALFLQKLGQQMVNFRGFSRNFSELLDSIHLRLLMSIESLNVFHWKRAKKIKVVVVLGQNLGQIRRNVDKKVKKQALSISFFHILHGE